MGMADFSDRYPSEVSGGQKRRAAIARALAAEPKLLLLDEPFVHLDRVVRSKLMVDLRRLVDETKIPAVLVTHDLDVAAQIADEISVMERGCVVQVGSREKVLFEPASPAVVRLFGDANIMVGEVVEFAGGLWHTETNGLIWKIPYIGELKRGQRVEVVIRSGAVKILKPDKPIPDELAVNTMEATLVHVDRRPDLVWAGFALGNGSVLTGSIPTDIFDRSGIQPGNGCEIGVTLDGIRFFPDLEQALN
jgi:ABC-type sulfate/molybdate transport systems ATPase subunit